MKSGSRLERVLEAGHFAFTGELGPPQGANVEAIRKKAGYLKGITDAVLLGQQILYGWEIYPIRMDNLAPLPFSNLNRSTGPAFFRGVFAVDQPHDTFLALPGWTKGLAWINGFCLGRYWNRGPQKTLYIPAPLLHPGENALVLFELHSTHDAVVELIDQPELG